MRYIYTGIPNQVRNDYYYLVLVTLNSFQGLLNFLQRFHAFDTEYLQHALNDAPRLSFRGSVTTEESP